MSRYLAWLLLPPLILTGAVTALCVVAFVALHLIHARMLE